MTNEDFKTWRKSMNLTQAEAGIELGMSRRAVQLIESGDYGKHHTEILRHIALACSALSAGLKPFGE